MARKPQEVTDAELAILEVLWEKGRASVRDITERLYPRGTGSDLATVQKLLKRLETKECVRCDKEAWPHQFEAGIEREELIGRTLQSTADKLSEGSLTSLLTHLVRGSKLSADERQNLRNLLKEFDDV